MSSANVESVRPVDELAVTPLHPRGHAGSKGERIGFVVGVCEKNFSTMLLTRPHRRDGRLSDTPPPTAEVLGGAEIACRATQAVILEKHHHTCTTMGGDFQEIAWREKRVCCFETGFV